MPENVINRNIEDEMKTSYLTYAMSVIVARALPDVRDGLKPVHRRVLYAMHRLGLTFNKPYKKSATVVGEVLGKYHPHGDQAIYDTLVRMAQTFSLRVPLIQGQGNFGSIDGDGAAAMRYTEARMSRISDELLKDIQKETVDFQNNFDDSLSEPTVLPSVFPNLLVNGTTGIAVGMATSIPPHNLREVIAAVIYYIDHNDCQVTDLFQFIKGPDFPTGGIIYNFQGVRDGYLTGKGIFKIRAKISLEEFKKNREAIIVTEIPYVVNKSELIKKIANLVKTEVIPGISEIRDESGKEGIRIVIELKKDVNTQIIINQLFKHTPLETSFSFNNVVIVDKAPRTLNLKELIFHFVNHRFEVITRRTQFDLRKAEERAHIVEGLVKAVLNIDEVIKIIRGSSTVDAARADLMKRFEFTEVQSQAILDMRLARLVALEIQKLNEEYQELLGLIKQYKEILAHPELIYTIIKEELAEISEKFSTDRLTEIAKSEIQQLEDEAFIQKANVVISLTKSGYIKRTSPEAYKQQHRGGLGVKSIDSKNPDDIISLLLVATTHDTLMFFTNKGKAYYLKAHEIDEASRTAKGSHIKMLFNLGAGEEVSGHLVFKDFDQANNFILVTAKGTVKKGQVDHLINAKRRGIAALTLKEGDTLVGTVEVKAGDHIIICSRKGFANRIHEEQFRLMGRTAAGVRGMNIKANDEVVGVEKVTSDHLLVVTERGMGKKINLDEFSPHSRGGKGQIYLKVNDKTGEVAVIQNVAEDDSILIITSSGTIIRLDAKEVNLLGRPATGTKLVSVEEPNLVVDAAVIKPLKELVEE